jgi:plastocyanin
MRAAARHRRVLLVACLAAACGGSDSPVDPGPPPPQSNPNRIVISSSGVSPVELVVAPGTRVLFVNNDTRRHFVTSDPHPEHDDCTALNQVGALQPGQSRESGNLVALGPCTFHDEDTPGNAGFSGAIIVR